MNAKVYKCLYILVHQGVEYMNYEEEAIKRMETELNNDATREMAKLIKEENEMLEKLEDIKEKKKKLQEDPKKYLNNQGIDLSNTFLSIA